MAISKDNRLRNKYVLQEDSTNDDFQKIIKSYEKVNCIICNSNTEKRFKTGLLSNSILTINNKLMDDVFYINGIY